MMFWHKRSTKKAKLSQQIYSLYLEVTPHWKEYVATPIYNNEYSNTWSTADKLLAGINISELNHEN